MDLTGTFSGGDLPKRDYVACEWHTEWGYTVSPGRMICTGRYKYTRYIEDGSEELFDLEKDSTEKRNLAGDSSHREVVEKMHSLLNEHLIRTKDPFNSLSWKADRRWRSHPAGYQNHKGIAAPMSEET